MSIAILMIRAIFLMASMLFFATYFHEASWLGLSHSPSALAIGAGVGFFLGAAIMTLEVLSRNLHLRHLNTLTIGIFFGYLLGQAAVLLFDSLFTFANLELQAPMLSLGHTFLFLCAMYWGLSLTARSSEELALTLPFIRFKGIEEKKRDLLLDLSILADTRIIDLCSSGIFDQQLILARFLIKEIYEQMEHGDENAKMRARRCLDVIKRLETMDGLKMRIVDTDFPDLKDVSTKLTQLAQVFHANILTAEISKMQQNVTEDTKVININTLSNAMKPPKQYGEFLQIKIQRYGKEPRQGVGYLDDGTMVVVNGGAEYIGEMIRSQVLSVKHTSSGRMIFCNAIEEGMMEGSAGSAIADTHPSASSSYYNHL